MDDGTRFPGTGYYVFLSDIVPQNVGFTGEDEGLGGILQNEDLVKE